MELINTHNAEFEQGLHTFTLALNKFADLTAAEFAAKYLGFRAPDKSLSIAAASNPSSPPDSSRRRNRNKTTPTPTDATTSAATTTASSSTSTSSAASTLPASYDMRTSAPNLMNPIQDQGQCGSCWAFATLALLETQYAKQYGSLVKFSEQYLVNCDSYNSGCDGGDPSYALYYASETGLPLASDVPYLAIDVSNPTCSGLSMVENSDSFTFDDTLSNLSNEELQQLVVEQGMIAVGIDGSRLQFYKSGILNGQSCSELNHAVNLIGYDTSSSSSSSYWILKNQWGTSWGESGYFRVAMNSNPCLIQKYAWTAEYN